MPARQIHGSVYSVGVVDWARTMFDALVPLPHGTSYNAYVVQGSEKTALIDAVEPENFSYYEANLASLNLEKVDYIISNHAEQDHSGSIPLVLEKYPDAKVVTTTKGKDLLSQLLDIPEQSFLVIEDRQTLSLGDKTLEFIFAPWVHWPETMLTFLQEDSILFSCDFMGSHLATSHLFASEEELTLDEAKRYYAEIMMPYARNIRNHLKVLEDYEIKMVAPSHGPVHDQPESIIEAYKEWSSEEVKNEVLLLYVSMHGSTERMALYFADALIERGVNVRPFNVVSADIGQIAMKALDAATLVFASPAVLLGVHPALASSAFLLNSLKPKARHVAIIGSFSWANKLSDQLQGFLSGLKAEFLPPLLTKGHPRESCYKELDALADEIAKRHAALEKS